MTAPPKDRSPHLATRLVAISTITLLLQRTLDGSDLHRFSSLTGIAGSIEASGPLPIAMIAVHLVALVAGWYLVAVGAVHAAGRATRWTAAVRLANACSTAAGRRLLGMALGTGLSASVSLAAVPLTAAGPVRPVLTSVPAPPIPSITGDLQCRPTEAGDDHTAALRSLAPDEALDESLARLDASGRSGSQQPEPVFVVRRGDHFWSIAKEQLASRGLTEVDLVDRYWRRLVEANTDRLVVPGDPDLLFPGQLIVLPPVE